MKKIAQLIVDLKNQGINLKLVGSNLELATSQGSIPEHFISIIKENKDSIIEFFKKNIKKTESRCNILPVEKKEYYIASSQQRSLYFIQEFEKKSTVYNSLFTIKINKKYLIQQIKKSIKILLTRHESLRSSFCLINGEVVQFVCPINQLEIDKVVSIADSVQLKNEKQTPRPFDLNEGQLFRVNIVEGTSSIKLLIEIHHIIYDGISVTIIENELKKLLENEKLKPLYLQYRDFSEWFSLNSDTNIIRRQKDYWLNMYENRIPELNLFPDSKIDNDGVFAGANCSFITINDEYEKLKGLATKYNCSIFHLIFTIFSILIHKVTGNKQFIIGTINSGRNYPNLEKVVGMFVNLLPILFKVNIDDQFSKYLSEVQNNIASAFDNQDYPFDELVNILDLQRQDGSTPLVDIVFALHNQIDENQRFDINGSDIIYSDDTISKFKMTMNVVELNDKFIFHWEFSKNYYSKSTIFNLVELFKTLIRSIVGDDDQIIREIPVIPESQKRKIELNNNFEIVDFPQIKLNNLWGDQVKNNLDKIALVQKDVQLSYNYIEARVNGLANYLKKQGIVQNSLVGILLEKTVDFYISILAIIRCGGTYVPIDIDYPKERVHYIIKDSNISLLITENKFLKKNGFAFKEGSIDSSEFKIMMIDKYFVNESKSNNNLNYNKIQFENNIVYVIYTSGSTGKPKGVLVKDKSVVNLILSQSQYFNITKDERIFQFSSLSFDASVEQIWLAFANGTTLIVPDKDLIYDKQKLEKYLINNCVSHIHAVPSFLEEIDMSHIPGLKRIIAGGDLCSTGLASEWYEKCNFYNEYGPTETTVTSSNYHVKDIKYSNIPIGRPISNTNTLILDEDNSIVPYGFAGELFIGGSGVAAGYMNNSELTQKRFVTLENYNGLFYKTGDIVRFHSDGEIEFLGRKDNQIKIRGYRVELQEVEICLISNKLIKQAVVIVLDQSNGSNSLCAYIVAEQKIENLVEETKRFLEQKLPAYMVPQYIIELEEIPKTFSGKINRNALEIPELIDNGIIVKPENKIESELLIIWADVFKIAPEKLSVTSGFFDLGGHSLKAMVLLSNIHKEIGVKIELKELFHQQTIRNQAKHILELSSSRFDKIQKAVKKRFYKITSSQKRLFLIQNLNLNTTAYNIPQLIKLSKGIGVDDVKKIFSKLSERHESLRTKFIVIENEPFQEICNELTIEVKEIFEIESKLFSETKNLIKPFDLTQTPLFKLFMIITEIGNKYLFIDAHHIIIDFVSHEILTNDFLKLSQGKTLDKLEFQYKDYSEWINSDNQKERIFQQEKYWLDVYKDGIPKLNLPMDYSRPPVFTYNGGRITEIISFSDLSEIIQLLKDNNMTMNMLLLSVFSIFLSKTSDCDKVVIGIPVSARTHADLHKVVGFFINTLALKFGYKKNQTLIEYLKDVKNVVFQALENQEFPFEDLQDKITTKRDLSQNQVFNIMFNYLNIDTNDFEESETVNFTEQSNVPSKFDLTLTVKDLEDKLILDFIYYKDIFKEETVQKFIKSFKTLLFQLPKKLNELVADICVLDNSEKKKLLYEFNDTKKSNYHLHDIIDKFNDCSVRFSKNNALIYSESIYSNNEINDVKSKSFTYEQLNEKSNQLANQLKELGVKPGAIVGLYFKPSIEMITSIIAVLKIGAIFLPINHDLPQKRIEYILNSASVDSVLTDLNDFNWANNSVKIQKVDFINVNKYNKEFLNCKNPNDQAYIIFTSGTTGTPKGVLVKNSGLVNYLNWFQDLANISEEDKTPLLTSFAFDLGYTALFSSILFGAELHLLHKSILSSPFEMLKYLSSMNISYVKLTPSLFSVLSDINDFNKLIMKLRMVVLGGEVIHKEDVVKSIKINNNLSIVNHYGPSEATIGCVACLINKDNIKSYQKNPVIGRPINNTQAYILDENKNLVSFGYEGMLYISGNGLAEGYLNEAENTINQFIPDLNFTNTNLYCTGDKAKWLENGTIEFIGRNDSQVKVNGYRIGLEEIENYILKYDEIRNVKIVLNKIGQNIDQLCCFLVIDQSGYNFSNEKLKKYLVEYFPAYMIPSIFKVVDEIPLTVNGKVDLELLLSFSNEDQKSIQRASNNTEEMLVKIWAELLNKHDKEICTKTNFFELGGNSLAVLKMIQMISDQFQLKLNPVTIFQFPTIIELEEFINKDPNQVNNEESEIIDYAEEEYEVINLIDE
ncbi:MAG: amino acid adenylation domain-containing protein [Bacteroidales bacterium]|nr:amino acid adenylation domain-containing protein [Bacteroidales bacterium]